MESTLGNIHSEVIDHKAQRYDTCGDYYEQRGEILFRISKLENWRYEYLILLHELIEWGLTKHQGISIDSIDQFDIKFEEDRAAGHHSPDSEPGDDKRAPYNLQHQVATQMEMFMADMIGVNWQEYTDKVNEL